MRILPHAVCPTGARLPGFVLSVVAALLLQLPAATLQAAERAAGQARLELRPGDRICLIGNTLAERMQHEGWLETLIYSRFPKHDLVIRNLGYSGDELTLRLRSAGFGTPDEHLASGKADVICAFFGYNESFAGEAGLAQFRADLEHFIDHTQSQKYNGTSPPRLVLFSPIAHENLRDRNLPDGRENNARLELYTRAMSEVAAAKGVPFVDLFHPTLEYYAPSRSSLTINGVHLGGDGDRLVGGIIDQALFGPRPAPGADPAAVEKLRQAVLDKNFHWFHRYRTVDGYSIYGGRADLAFVDGQTNRVVMQRELEVLDAMTANRDRRIWAVAQGKDLPVDDSNVPPFIPVKTNKPGAGPGGTHLFAGGEEAITKMKVAEGMQVALFASEEMFPELAKPVQMAFDTRGRLWVAVMPSYPHWKPGDEMNDKVIILEDTDADGRADRCKTFADRLHVPTGLEFWNGGLLVGAQPDLMFLKDTDGDDVADVRVRVLHGIDSADTHHALNSFVLDPGGALYFQEGTFHHTQVETPYGPPVRCANAGVFRYEPRTQKFEVYVSYGFANPHGHVFDRYGQDIVHDGTGANPFHGSLFSVHVEFPRKLPAPPQVYAQRTRPCPATEYLSSRHFPDQMQGNLLVANVIGFHGILRYRISDNGASFSGTEAEPIVQSSDENFRPTDLEIGPDGAIWFLDWQNPIIGHMQHNLRDPSRDQTHGRVYRVTMEGRPLLEPARIAGEPIVALLDLLKSPEDRVRYRARIELSGRDSGEVIAAAKTWIARLDPGHPDYEQQVLEGLWLHQQHNLVDPVLLKRVLGSPDFRVRAAAVRVLCAWRDRIPEALDLLRSLAADQQPRVRLEAIRASSYFTVPEAVEVALISAEHSTDVYLDYVRNETLKTLEPYWKRALLDGRVFAVSTEAGLTFLARNLSIDELRRLPPARPALQELLLRPGVREEHRREALTGLARLEREAEPALLVEMLRLLDESPGRGSEGAVFDLVRMLASRPPAELAELRGDLEALATAGKTPLIRQLGFVLLITANGAPDRAWDVARSDWPGLLDLVTAMPMIPDPGLRASLYPQVEPLLRGLPDGLAATSGAPPGAPGRYVRIELSGRRPLTLAEVEVYSSGRNMAPQGKASQKNTAHGGAAARAIDGKTSGAYGDGGQTHTQETATDPWWELDLGQEQPIESIAVYNRTDADLGRRLDGFTIRVLDGQRRELFVAAGQSAPDPKSVFDVAGAVAPESLVRRAAMAALASVRGKETETFQALARFAREGADRPAAVAALLRIPALHVPPDEAPALVESLVASIRDLPPQARTTPEALGSIELVSSLAGLLPSDAAKAVRRELGELAVPVLRLGTVTDQMLFDKERLVVQAGKPVEFVFENTDIMPHNFVVAKPGALEEVGLLAESTATQPGALERHYVPPSDKILVASALLQPRQSQKLPFTAPREAGIYPYVCTYPGHWRRMYGALYVVESLDEYLADPEGYLAAHPVPIEDPLLKYNRPRKAWTLEELSAIVETLEQGRSFANGKQMFQVAGCVSCHKLSGTGQQFGPDLAKLDPKLKAVDVLKEIFDPSAKIDEKYRPQVFELESGKIVSGLVVEETPRFVRVVENPLASAEPTALKTSEIADRQKSNSSIMPKGLFDRLTREEILDLVAFVVARGDAAHPLFEGGHEHHH